MHYNNSNAARRNDSRKVYKCYSYIRTINLLLCLRYDAIASLMTKTHPGRKFVVVGDSTGSDPEVRERDARLYVQARFNSYGPPVMQ